MGWRASSFGRWSRRATERCAQEDSGFRSDQDPAYKGANYGWQKFIGKPGTSCRRAAINVGIEKGGGHEPSTIRLILRWIHIIVAIPIHGYIYSPFEELPL
jgi:hypothetical protein